MKDQVILPSVTTSANLVLLGTVVKYGAKQEQSRPELSGITPE